MKVYDSTGNFNSLLCQFNLTVQTTNISPDSFLISGYYDISNTTRFALLAILQTANGDKTDFRNYPPDSVFTVTNGNFNGVDTSYLTPQDKNLKQAVVGDTIHVIVHDGIGFDPVTNRFDNQYIVNYKAETYTYYAKGSQPGKGGKGHLG